jgi:hypothetical protein
LSLTFLILCCLCRRRHKQHYLRDLLTKVAKTSQPWVATLVRTIFDQPDAAEVAAQFDRVIDALDGKLPAAAGHLAAARDDLLAFTAVPREIWRQIWSSNPPGAAEPELRRCTDVVGIFPGRDAIVRLVGAVLMEQNDEWTEARRYMGLPAWGQDGADADHRRRGERTCSPGLVSSDSACHPGGCSSGCRRPRGRASADKSAEHPDRYGPDRCVAGHDWRPYRRLASGFDVKIGDLGGDPPGWGLARRMRASLLMFYRAAPAT